MHTDTDPYNEKGDRFKPLLEILEEISSQPPHQQRALADVIERSRLDLWIYRRVLTGKQFSDHLFCSAEKSPIRLFSMVLDGLSHRNLSIRTICYALAARIDYRIAKTIVDGTSITSKDISNLKSRLFNRATLDSLDVGKREKAALIFLTNCTATNFQDALYKKENYEESPKLNLDEIKKEYDKTEKRLRLIDSSWRPGLPIKIHAIEEERQKQAEAGRKSLIPWMAFEYLLPIGLGLDAIVKLYWRIKNVENVSGGNARDLLNQARDLAQTAWLVVRQLRVYVEAAVQTGGCTTLDVDLRALKIREQALLDELADLERALFNHTRAAIYAVSALRLLHNLAEEDSGYKESILAKPDVKRLFLIARSHGLMVPARINNKTQTTREGWAFSGESPPYKARNLQERVFICKHEICEVVNALEKMRFVISEKGEKLVTSVAINPLSFKQDVRFQCYRLALRTGNIIAASTIAAPSKKYIARRISSNLNVENERVLALPKKELLRFAKVLWSIYHKALPYIDHSIYKGLRIALRQLWKRWSIVNEGRANGEEPMNFGETLVIHEVKRGLYHGSIERLSGQKTIVWGTYNNLTDHQQELLYDHFAAQVPEGFHDPLPYDELSNVKLNIPEDTVFISLGTRDGHELSIAIASRESFVPPFIVETADEKHRKCPDIHWTRLAEELLGTHEFWSLRKRGQRDINPIIWNDNFIKLGKILLKHSIQLNPKVNCVALATDAVLRGLPWQHLISVALGNYLRYLREQHTANKTEISKGIFIRHVFGATQFIGDTEEKMYRSGASVVIYGDEPEFQTTKTELAEHRKNWDSGISKARVNSLLTILAHGDRNNIFSRILMGKEPLSDNEHKELGGYAVTLLHSCHTGYVEKNPLGDIGGMPGFLLSHGSELVIAPVAAVSPETAWRFDGYVTTWLRDPNKGFEEMYLDAIRERKEVSLYSVYGNPHMIDALKRGK